MFGVCVGIIILGMHMYCIIIFMYKIIYNIHLYWGVVCVVKIHLHN